MKCKLSQYTKQINKLNLIEQQKGMKQKPFAKLQRYGMHMCNLFSSFSRPYVTSIIQDNLETQRQIVNIRNTRLTGPELQHEKKIRFERAFRILNKIQLVQYISCDT